MDKWMTLQENRRAADEREWREAVDAMVASMLLAEPGLPKTLALREAAREVSRQRYDWPPICG